MIVRVFKSSQPISYLLMPAWIGLAWLGASYSGNPGLIPGKMPLYHLIEGMLSGWPRGLLLFTGMLINCAQVFYLNHVVGKHEVLYRNSYLPGLFFGIFLTLFPNFLQIHPVLFVNCIMLVVLDKIFKIYKNPAPLSLIFDCFFLISLSTLIYLPSLLYLLVVVSGILILKTFSWRDWMVGITGFLLPLFFAFVYFFVTDSIPAVRDFLATESMLGMFDTGGFKPEGFEIAAIILALLFVLTVVRIRQNFYKNTTKIRNFQQVIFIFLIVSFLTLLVHAQGSGLFRFAMLTIPYSIMVSYYFLAAKKSWWAELLFYTLASVIVYNFVISVIH